MSGDFAQSYDVTVLLMVPVTIPLIQNLGLEMQRARNKHQFRSVVYIIMAFLNLGLSIPLCQEFGIRGAALGTSIAMIVANGFIMNWYYHSRLDIDIMAFWKNILILCPTPLVMLLFGLLLTHFISINSFMAIFFGAALYSVVYCVMAWLFGMNHYEKGLVQGALRKLKTLSG